MHLMRSLTVRALALSAMAACAALAPTLATAGVLPEDRADVLFHRYDGGGVVIQGPSVLVRKKFKDKVSVVANYYQDMVSSASIERCTRRVFQANTSAGIPTSHCSRSTA